MKSKQEQLNELHGLVSVLRQDLPITELEKHEYIFKQIIRDLFEQFPGDEEVLFTIAQTQKEIGLLCKYKSYGVKACTPLGYAIFLLNEGEGFSFQNHLDFKVELFHILQTRGQGYAFISSAEEWNVLYQEDSFKEWFEGKDVSMYERFRINPNPGDVIKIDTTGIVHTAIGCILEEYANVSTDMVQRLYDQNAGRKIPEQFSRVFVEKTLSMILFPDHSSIVSIDVSHTREQINEQKIEYGRKIILHDTDDFFAARTFVDPAREEQIMCDDRYISIYITEGKGELILNDRVLEVKKGDPVLLVPNSHWKLRNTSNDSVLAYSMLGIKQEHALK